MTVATSSDVEIATFTVTDAYMVDISSGNENSHFYIMYDYASTASLYVSASYPLDYESATSHTLTIEAWDMMMTSSASGSLTVNVINVPAPTFTITGPASGFPVSEAAGAGTVVGTLTATDPQNDIYMYSISSGDPNYDFSIDETGQITVQGTLDHETTPSYTLTVDATGMGGNSASTNVTITVTDVAEATTGWTIASPSDSTTVEVTEFEPVVISGPRGTNPEGKVITLDIWWLGDEDAEEPYATFVLDDGTGSVFSGDWSVSALLPSGEFFAEVLWDGIVVPMINNPKSVTFIVNRQIGDPIP